MKNRGTSRRRRQGGAGQALRGVLLLATFAGGFTVTGIEIALGRLLAPFFGASLTVWAAIIASVIAALAVGYPLGGILADRRPGAALPLAALALGGFSGAALGLGAPLWLGHSMAGVGLSGAGYWARLAGVLLLFSVPCILLASVPPAVLRLTLRERNTAGRDAGLLYALGSAGSVLGILLPALWWIPLFGLRTTFLLLATVSGVPVALGILRGAAPRILRPAAAGLALLGAAAFLPASVEIPVLFSGKVLYDRDSGLQRIRVIARDTPRHRRRWLQLNEGWSVHSALIEPDLVTNGVWDWTALTALLPRPDDGRTDVLILGLAGGTVSNLITHHLRPLLPDLAIVGVEIDPQVIEVADLHLALDRSHLETVAADGRVWLRRSERRFDLILLDAYQQPSIPAHLATREFFDDVAAHLSPGGLAVLNAFAPAGGSELIGGLSATWRSIFPTSQWLVGAEADGFASHLFFGGPAVPLDFARHDPGSIPAPLRTAWRVLRSGTRPLPEPAGAPSPWTDDRVPVELLTDHAFRSTRPPNPPLQSG